MKGKKTHMGVELFNKTNNVKILPKFNYKGKFKLYPGCTKSIEEYMISFYKPYEKIGISIRHTIDKVVIEKEVKKVIDNLEQGLTKSNVAPEESNSAESVKIEGVESTESASEVVGDVRDGEDTKEVVNDTFLSNSLIETSSTDEVDKLANPNVKVYSEEELEGLKINEMKSILDERNVDYNGVSNRRNEYVKLILDTQQV